MIVRQLRGAEYLHSEDKRRLDAWGGFIIGAALLPLAGSAALASDIDHRSWNPIFTQDRIGPDEDSLKVRKFRTIRERAKGPDLETYGTHDPRASIIGQVIRQSGIDEWPQLLQVAKGDLSLVGLRPMLQETLDDMSKSSPELFKEWYESYQEFRHGLTSPGQLYRRRYINLNKEVWKEVMKRDLKYFENASMTYDFKILGSTALKLIYDHSPVLENQDQPEPSLVLESQVPPEPSESIAS